MIHFAFDPDKVYAGFAGYGDWKIKAAVAAKALTAWMKSHPTPGPDEKPPVDAEIYSALKPYLQTYFRGKCAYCESFFKHVAWGDVEHYRPKRLVKDEPKHRGYYWLAYSEANLMPSCQLCNQGKGKKNWFPIAGKRAWTPGANLDAELPLLLNPYHQEDCADFARESVARKGPAMPKHLWYDFTEQAEELFATGVAIGISQQGLKSIEVYDLNRADLVKQRQEVQNQAIESLTLGYNQQKPLVAVLTRLLSDDQEHASAVRATCVEFFEYRRKKQEKAIADAAIAP